MENCYFNQVLDIHLFIDIYPFDFLKKIGIERPLRATKSSYLLVNDFHHNQNILYNQK